MSLSRLLHYVPYCQKELSHNLLRNNLKNTGNYCQNFNLLK